MCPHLIDLSHTIEPGMPQFPGLPSPKITPLWTHAEAPGRGYEGTSCELTQIQMVTSIGTYLDAPYHFDPNGPDVSQLGLKQLVVAATVIDVREKATPRVGLLDSVLAGHDVQARAALLLTGWSDRWGDDRYYDHPFVSRELAESLCAARPALVGIDTLVIDDPRDMARPAHTLLLRAGVPIVENLTGLDRLVGRECTFVAAPAKVAAAAAFPVRAFAIVHGDR